MDGEAYAREGLAAALGVCPLHETSLRHPSFGALMTVLLRLSERGFARGLFEQRELLDGSSLDHDAKVWLVARLLSLVAFVRGGSLALRVDDILDESRPSVLQRFLGDLGFIAASTSSEVIQAAVARINHLAARGPQHAHAPTHTPSPTPATGSLASLPAIADAGGRSPVRLARGARKPRTIPAAASASSRPATSAGLNAAQRRPRGSHPVASAIPGAGAGAGAASTAWASPGPSRILAPIPPTASAHHDRHHLALSASAPLLMPRPTRAGLPSSERGAIDASVPDFDLHGSSAFSSGGGGGIGGGGPLRSIATSGGRSASGHSLEAEAEAEPEPSTGGGAAPKPRRRGKSKKRASKGRGQSSDQPDGSEMASITNPGRASALGTRTSMGGTARSADVGGGLARSVRTSGSTVRRSAPEPVPLPPAAQLVQRLGGRQLFDAEWLTSLDFRLRTLSRQLHTQMLGRADAAPPAAREWPWITGVCGAPLPVAIDRKAAQAAAAAAAAATTAAAATASSTSTTGGAVATAAPSSSAAATPMPSTLSGSLVGANNGVASTSVTEHRGFMSSAARLSVGRVRAASKLDPAGEPERRPAVMS